MISSSNRENETTLYGDDCQKIRRVTNGLDLNEFLCKHFSFSPQRFFSKVKNFLVLKENYFQLCRVTQNEEKNFRSSHVALAGRVSHWCYSSTHDLIIAMTTIQDNLWTTFEEFFCCFLWGLFFVSSVEIIKVGFLKIFWRSLMVAVFCVNIYFWKKLKLSGRISLNFWKHLKWRTLCRSYRISVVDVIISIPNFFLKILIFDFQSFIINRLITIWISWTLPPTKSSSTSQTSIIFKQIKKVAT